MESYQQEYREMEPDDAKLWGDDGSGVEGFVSGNRLTLNENFELVATTTAANAFTVGEVGYLVAAGTITMADADAVASVNPLVVMALGTIAAGEEGTFQMPVGKKVTVTGHGFTVGAALYISGTAGELTSTAPGAGGFIRIVAYALDANTLYFTGGGGIAAGS